MSKPLIGVTTSHLLSKYGHTLLVVGEAYTQAVQRAGGIPVLLPLDLGEAEIQHLLDRLDGILLTGGGDIDPARYGGQPHPTVYDIDEMRDQMEIHLAQQVVAQGKPFLGICRGFQVLNAALGGSLYEDILAQHSGAIKHDYFPDYPRTLLSHGMRVEVGSRLASILGATELETNSLHHQGVRQVGNGLAITAHAPDGIVEAVEYPGHPFGLAVQWHPEWMQEALLPATGQFPMRQLFQALVDAARQAGPV